MPRPSVRRSSGVVPRRARRVPLSAVAPTMIGSAIVRESRFAWSREKWRQRAAARVTPLRETPGGQRRRLGDAEREPVGRGRFAAPAPLRPGVGDEHRRGAGEQAVGGRARDRRGGARSAAPGCSRRPPPAGRRGRAAAPAGRRTRAAPRRSAAAGRPAAPAAAPVCSATSKLLRSSGSIASQSQPASQGTRTMWAELETGSSSAGPWTIPSAIARRVGSRPSPAALKRRWCRPAREPRRARPRPRPGRRRAAA